MYVLTWAGLVLNHNWINHVQLNTSILEWRYSFLVFVQFTLSYKWRLFFFMAVLATAFGHYFVLPHWWNHSFSSWQRCYLNASDSKCSSLHLTYHSILSMASLSSRHFSIPFMVSCSLQGATLLFIESHCYLHSISLLFSPCGTKYNLLPFSHPNVYHLSYVTTL